MSIAEHVPCHALRLYDRVTALFTVTVWFFVAQENSLLIKPRTHCTAGLVEPWFGRVLGPSHRICRRANHTQPFRESTHRDRIAR
jgi:hypothetical protein